MTWEEKREKEVYIAKKGLRFYHVAVALFLSIIIAFGMQLSPALPTGISKGEMAALNDHPVQHFLISIQHSIMKRPDTILQSDLMALLLLVLILLVISRSHQIRITISCAIVSLLFGLSVWLGRIFHRGPFWNDAMADSTQRVKSLWIIFSYGCFFFVAMLALTMLLNSLSTKMSSGEIRSLSLKKRAVIYTVLLLLCWLPVYFIFWPGNIKGDVAIQILQYFHFPTIFQGHWITDGVNTIYSNDHPVLQTLLLGSFMRLGHLLGWNELGVGLYTLIQLIGFVGAVAMFLVSLEYFDTDRRFIYAMLLLYCIMPVFSIHVVLISGDSFMTLFFMYYVLALFWIFKTRGKVLDRRAFRIALVILTVLFCASKNQCIYIAVLTGLMLLWLFRGRWKQVLVVALLPLLIYQFLYTGVFFSVMRINKVGTQEAFSLTFQQVARTVKYHKEEIPEEESRVIAGVLDYEHMGENYDPDLADPVKMTYNPKATSADLMNYLQVWMKLGIRYPGEYVQAFLDFTSDYYYPLPLNRPPKYYWKCYGTDQIYQMSWVPNVVPESFFKELSVVQPESLTDCRDAWISFIKVFHYMPVFDWFAYSGTVIWAVFTVLLMFWLRKDYQSLQLFFPLLLCAAICFLSPKNGNFRYILPDVFLLPVIITCVLHSYQGKNGLSKK